MIAGPSPRSTRRPIGIAALRLCLPFKKGSARESAGNNRKEGVHVAAAPAPFLVNGAAGSASTIKERIRFLSEPLLGSVWPRADLFGYIIQVESGVTGTAV